MCEKPARTSVSESLEKPLEVGKAQDLEKALSLNKRSQNQRQLRMTKWKKEGDPWNGANSRGSRLGWLKSNNPIWTWLVEDLIMISEIEKEETKENFYS